MPALDWTFFSRPTAFHVAAGLDAGWLPVSTELATSIERPLAESIDRLRGLDVDRPAFWRHLIAASASTDATAQIVTTALARVWGPVQQRPTAHLELTGLISAIVGEANPHLIESQELEMRSQPLQTQWQTYGSGLMHWIVRRTDPHVLVDQARLIVVQPVFGGGGGAHLSANSAHIESMMVNPDESIPEVLRLAWMISQLQNDLPTYSETINRRQLHTISGLAMLPVTLEAGAELGLSALESNLLERAIATWHLFDDDPALAAEIVETWWQTVTRGSFQWGTALQALDRMIQPITCVPD